MKIEPRKIKKTLKYATVGTCVATSLIATGCNKEQIPATENTPISVTATPEEGTLSTPPHVSGIIVAPTEDVPTGATPKPDELYIDGDIAFPENTPEIAGGIPTPEPESEDVYFAGVPPMREN